MAGAHHVHIPAGTRSGDPPAFARRRRNAAIKRASHLEGHKGAVFRNARQEPGMIAPRFGVAQTHVHADTCITQHADPAPGDTGVRIAGGDHDTGDPCVYQGLRAGGCLAVVRTGLQRDIGCCPSGRVAGLCQSTCFRMWPAPVGRPAAPDDPAVADNHTSDSRVRPDTPHPAPPQRQGERHEAYIALECHVSFSSLRSGRNSLTNLSKSSAAWKFL